MDIDSIGRCLLHRDERARLNLTSKDLCDPISVEGELNVVLVAGHVRREDRRGWIARGLDVGDVEASGGLGQVVRSNSTTDTSGSVEESPGDFRLTFLEKTTRLGM